MPGLGANTGIRLAIPVEEPVTSPRRAKANHKRLTRWKNQSLLRSVLMIQSIHSRLHYTIWARVAMTVIEVPVELNGTPHLMELATGAGVSPSETYTRHFKDTPLHPSNTRLHTYTGHPVKVSGQLDVHLTYQDQSADVPVLVVEGSVPPLFGRDWLSHIKLDWKKIRSIRVSDTGLPQDVKSRLHTVIQSYPEVFKPGLGTIKGFTAKLEMKSDAQPKFCKARPVPYALQEAVVAEYSRLVAEGIVEKVEFSEWAAPMVHVPKSDGTTRSCGDYAVTVNPQLNVPQYPIPLPEDVFIKLQGGQRFT